MLIAHLRDLEVERTLKVGYRYNMKTSNFRRAHKKQEFIKVCIYPVSFDPAIGQRHGKNNNESLELLSFAMMWLASNATVCEPLLEALLGSLV